MGKANYSFVLWGNQFEAVPATIFVTSLRKAGLCVKIVSLNASQCKGAYGLALQPDLTLGKALSLANRSSCIIIPYSSPDITQLINDPRLPEFLSKAKDNGAKFVVGHLSKSEIGNIGLPPGLADCFVTYPDMRSADHAERLFKFADELARSLRTSG